MVDENVWVGGRPTKHYLDPRGLLPILEASCGTARNRGGGVGDKEFLNSGIFIDG